MNQDLARTHLIKHSKSERNGRFPEVFSHEAKMTNPICGDHVELRIHTTNDIITDVGHKAQACAICSASASILCEEVKGKDIKLALSMGEIFEKGVMEAQNLPWPTELANLVCFEHLRVNPSRKMCALLPWVVLKSAMKKGQHDHN